MSGKSYHNLSNRAYHRRARRARRRMTREQIAAFDALVIDRLSLPQAAEMLDLTEDEILHRAAKAFRIHVTEIERERSWWRWW